MPIYHTSINPHLDLTSKLGKLKVIAAMAKILGQNQLSDQALEIHDKLVDSYNSQLPEDKPKGFWRQFADNLTFRDLDTTTITRLKRYQNSREFEEDIEMYSTWDKNMLIEVFTGTINSLY